MEREVELPGPIYVRWSVFDRLTIEARQKHTTVEALVSDLIDDQFPRANRPPQAHSPQDDTQKGIDPNG